MKISFLFNFQNKGYAGTAYGFVAFEDERDAEVNKNNFLFFFNNVFSRKFWLELLINKIDILIWMYFYIR